MRKLLIVFIVLLFVKHGLTQENSFEQHRNLIFMMLCSDLMGKDTIIPKSCEITIHSVYKSVKKAHIPGTTEIYELGMNYNNKSVTMRFKFNLVKKIDSNRTNIIDRYWIYHPNSSFAEDSIADLLSGDAYDAYFEAEIDSNSQNENDPKYAVYLFKNKNRNIWYYSSSISTVKVKARLNPVEYLKVIREGKDMDEFKHEEIIGLYNDIRFTADYYSWDLIQWKSL